MRGPTPSRATTSTSASEAPRAVSSPRSARSGWTRAWARSRASTARALQRQRPRRGQARRHRPARRCGRLAHGRRARGERRGAHPERARAGLRGARPGVAARGHGLGGGRTTHSAGIGWPPPSSTSTRVTTSWTRSSTTRRSRSRARSRQSTGRSSLGGRRGGALAVLGERFVELRPDLARQVVAHAGNRDETGAGNRPGGRHAAAERDQRVVGAVDDRRRDLQLLERGVRSPDARMAASWRRCPRGGARGRTWPRRARARAPRPGGTRATR